MWLVSVAVKLTAAPNLRDIQVPQITRTQSSKSEETPIERIPSVAFGPRLGQVDFSQDGFDTKAKVAGAKRCILHSVYGK